MKTKKISQKLNLKKATVARLDNMEMKEAVGGNTIFDTICGWLRCETEPWTDCNISIPR